MSPGPKGHVVVEEAPPSPRGDDDPSPQVVALSARTPKALSRMIRDLAARLAEEDDAFADLAFTLQTGREGYEERLAFVAASRGEALATLSALADERAAAVAVFRGRTRRGGAGAVLDGAEAVAHSLDDPALDDLARAWVEGLPVNWRGLHRGKTRRRVALPPYPLDPISHWLPAGRVPLIPVETKERVVTRAVPVVEDEDETLLLRPLWLDKPVSAEGVSPSSRLVLLCGLPAALAEGLQRALGDAPSRVIGAQSADPGDDFMDVATAVMTLLRDLLLGPEKLRPGLVQLVAPKTPCAALTAGLSGLAGTLAQETVSPVFQSIAIDPAVDAVVRARFLDEDSRCPKDRLIRHDGGHRQVRRLAELPSGPALSRPWRDGGCYVISGGLGGWGGCSPMTSPPMPGIRRWF